MTTLHSLSPAESIMEETTHPTATTDRHQKPTSDNGLHEEDAQVWAAFGDNFRNVQSMLDRNRALIQQVNENHQSKIADNMVKNVPLIQEINDNISKVVSLYSDFSSNFFSTYQERNKDGDGGGKA